MKLYTWTTPNGYKVPIILEELGLPYEIVPIDISKGAQLTPEYIAVNPNHKIPVLVDDMEIGGTFTLSESGAILIYLAEKHGALLSKEAPERYTQIQWLMFQMSAVGPMFGQAKHFSVYAPERIEYAIKRYFDEANRLMHVLETRLARVPYLGGEYSIADIATWPWIRSAHEAHIIDIEAFPNIARWYHTIESRPAVVRAYERLDRETKGDPAVCIPKFDDDASLQK